MTPPNLDKRISSAAHTLKEQLKTFLEMVEQREGALKQPWVDTVPDTTETEANESIDEMRIKWQKQRGISDA